MFGDQAGRLQRLSHKRVAEAHVVLAADELMEVANLEALRPVTVESEHTLDLVDGRSFRRRHLPPPVEQAVVASC